MPMLTTRGSASARSLAMDGAQRVRRSFPYVSNALQSWTVPDGVSQVNVEVAGGGGGGSSNSVNTGGGRGGAVVTGKLVTTPASTLYIAAAQAGSGSYVSYAPGEIVFQFAGGWPGGGPSGNGALPYPQVRQGAGSGGGLSGIFSANSVTQGNTIVMASGGGGRGNNVDVGLPVGGNATVIAGGASSGTSGSTAGAALQGGEGGNYAYTGGYPGGGGGGGYFGGGGGAGSSSYSGGNSAGGNGSSFFTVALIPAVTVAESNTRSGYVTISW